MRIIYLGQAGFLIKKGQTKVMIDPYLSNSVEKIDPKKYRRQRIDESFLKIKPDVLIFTHDHLDHYDEETVKNYLRENSRVLVLAPVSVWQRVRRFGGDNNYILFNRKTVISFEDFVFQAVKAEHSDKDAIGVIITCDGKNYYMTGDTLYNEEIFGDLPNELEAVFLPINGVGNNMNAVDGAKFAKKTGAKKVVPIHFGLFDEMTGEELRLSNKIIPKIYEEIKL